MCVCVLVCACACVWDRFSVQYRTTVDKMNYGRGGIYNSSPILTGVFSSLLALYGPSRDTSIFQLNSVISHKLSNIEDRKETFPSGVERGHRFIGGHLHQTV